MDYFISVKNYFQMLLIIQFKNQFESKKITKTNNHKISLTKLNQSQYIPKNSENQITTLVYYYEIFQK